MTGIVYAANSAKLGGGNRVLMDIVTRLDRTRFLPIIVAPGVGRLLDWARQSEIPVRVNPSGSANAERRGALTRQAAFFAFLVMRYRARIVHAMEQTCYRPAGLAGLLTGAVRICHLEFPPEAAEIEWAFRVSPDVVDMPVRPLGGVPVMREASAKASRP